MKRQAIQISLNDLVVLFMELKGEIENINKELKIDNVIDFNKKFLVSIINKKPKCSDTWELEK